LHLQDLFYKVLFLNDLGPAWRLDLFGYFFAVSILANGIELFCS
jgi:hypothetical protein